MTPAARRRRWGPVLTVVALVVVGGSLATGWWVTAAREGQDGTPKLVVDRDAIDLGPLAFNAPARATFTLTNAGDGNLTIDGVPRVKAVQGC